LGRSGSAASETAEEHRVWELLTRDFYWQIPPDHPVAVYEAGGIAAETRLQIFEMAVTTILAHMRPDFEWSVTPNRQDRGVDFVGVHRFLDDGLRGINAEIKIGGQCKKRTTINDVVGEIAGSLIRMGDAINPTFFVVALSARLTKRRVEEARRLLERQCLRHCHILDRAQLEALLGDYLDVFTEILDKGLEASEVAEVLAYFETRSAPRPTVTALPPARVLAGTPFRVSVDVRWVRASNPDARVWWRPAAGNPGEVDLIGPLGADGPAGVKLASQPPADDPVRASFTVELTTHSVGQTELGEIVVGVENDPKSHERAPLGQVDVVETMRPRFFDRPFVRELFGFPRPTTRCWLVSFRP
jgi:hypothetical protein